MNIISNKSLNNAKVKKNDEFYTSCSDIENELVHYLHLLKGKSIYLPCDNPESSNFWKYFSTNFKSIGLNELSATWYNSNGMGGMALIEKLYDDPDEDGGCLIMENRDSLIGDGDFRSEECKPFFDLSDIVITNPPFSLMRSFIDILFKYNKKFILLGNINMITYKNIFPYIKSGEIKIGYNFDKRMKFTTYDGSTRTLGGHCWFTNLDINPDRLFEFSGITYKGNEYKYPKYDNYDAINVDRVKDIPCDYYGVMGVPITFIGKYNQKEFEIVSFGRGDNDKVLTYTRERERE